MVNILKIRIILFHRLKMSTENKTIKIILIKYEILVNF